MPKLQFHSAAKPSLYGYIPPLEKEKKEEKEKVECTHIHTYTTAHVLKLIRNFYGHLRLDCSSRQHTCVFTYFLPVLVHVVVMTLPSVDSSRRLLGHR